MSNWKIAELIILLRDIESAQRIQIFFPVSSLMMCCNFCSRVIKAQFLLLLSIYDDIEQIYFEKNETG